LRDLAADSTMDLDGNTRIKLFALVWSRKYFADGY